MTLLIITAIVYIFYVVLVTAKFGKPTSISATSYDWLGKQRWYFVLWLAVLAGLVYYQPLGGFSLYASLGLFGAGLTFEHKRDPEKLEDDAHTVFTVIGIASIFLSFIFLHGMWLPAGMLIVLSGIAYMVDRHHFIFWLENAAFASALYGLAALQNFV